jgi:hypothetical protein
MIAAENAFAGAAGGEVAGADNDGGGDGVAAPGAPSVPRCEVCDGGAA